MNSHTTRRLLAGILAFLITIAFCISSFLMALKFTVFSADMVASTFSTHLVADASHSTMQKRFQALSAKSNIPMDIFENVASVESVKNVQDDLIHNAYIGKTTNLNNDALRQMFYTAFEAYYKQNNIPIDQSAVSDLNQLTEQAAKIYAECADMSFAKSFATAIPSMNSYATRILPCMFLAMAIFILLIFYMYKRKKAHKCGYYIASSFIASGVLLTLLSAGVLIRGFKSYINITPAVFADAFNAIAVTGFLIVFGLGMVCLVGGLLLFISIQKIYKSKHKNDTSSHRRVYVKLFDSADSNGDAALDPLPDDTE